MFCNLHFVSLDSVCLINPVTIYGKRPTIYKHKPVKGRKKACEIFPRKGFKHNFS